jgi:hypothetical protein
MRRSRAIKNRRHDVKAIKTRKIALTSRFSISNPFIHDLKKHLTGKNIERSNVRVNKILMEERNNSFFAGI